MLTDQLF